MTIEKIKQRFEIIGNSPLINRAIDTAMQVAPTDITVLIAGESGTGKEVFPKIIHYLSARKHGLYIAVNCGAIPEGTIDSELFGHEKGAFTGAHEARKGYFEVANGGTIFLDEVSELPLQTQVRLLRVLETGEFIKVGSSKVQKTNVRIAAATNVNLLDAIYNRLFREDLYYRLCTVPITIPPLRHRKEDIHLFFRKFAADFAEKYRMPSVRIDDEGVKILENFRWPGNVRQLKNITEQISVIEENREISADTLLKYLPQNYASNLPVLIKEKKQNSDYSERELLYKLLFDMRNDITDLKKLVAALLNSHGENIELTKESATLIKNLYPDTGSQSIRDEKLQLHDAIVAPDESETESSKAGEQHDQTLVEEELLSLQENEKDLIRKAIKKHKSNKAAAKELGISERTLYRKIRAYNIS